MKVGDKIVRFDFSDEPKHGLETTFFDPANVYYNEENSLLGLFTDISKNLTEDRVREIVREELLDFKLQYLREDTLFQRILSEIRREKSGKRNPRK